MPSPDLESRILDLACSRGLLSESQVRAAAESAPAPGPGDPWPPRIMQLLRSGALSAELLDALAWEAEAREAPRPANPPSWTALALPELPSQLLPEDLDWDRYQSLSFLGMGGSARVYKAYDPRLERWVALKFLKGSHPGQEEAMLREARAQAQVEHPHVCKIYEVGEVSGLHYIAMQLVQGPPLSLVMGGLTLEEKVALVRDVAEGIRAAHLRGLVHLDIKPGNILLEPTASGSYHPYVTDFGLVSRESVSLQGFLGTPPYSSPEQVRGDLAGVDRRSDIYSLGVLLYVLLGEALPFEAPSKEALLQRILDTPPIPLRQRVPDIPEDLEIIVGTCLRKVRERRYASAAALAEDLQRFLDGEPIQARPATRLYRLRKWMERNRALAGVAGVSALIALVAAGMGLRASLRARALAHLAQRYGQEAERIEALVRYAHLQPPHDIRPEIAGIQARLAGLQAEVDQAGSLARGPGFHALGRGFLALGRLEEAKDRLDRAWRAGERGPSMELDLGRVLGSLYDEGLAELSSLQGNERKRRREELERNLRDPALAHLRKAQAESPAEAAYQEALAAFYEEHFAEARDRAREALRQAPWFYEAAVLEGEVRLAEARGKVKQAARKEEALADLMGAGDPLATALARGGSDPRTYLREADRWYSIAFYDSLYRPQEEDAAIQKGLEVLDRARAVQEDLASIHLLRSQFLWVLGRQRGLRGGEAEGPFREARAAVERAIQLDPDNARAHQIRADVLSATAEWLSARGRDALEPLREGLASLNRAIALGRRDHYTYRSLGYLLHTEANELYARGQDPRDTFQRTLKAYEQAIALDPADTMSLNNSSVICGQTLEMDLDQGHGDPALADRGLAFIDQGLVIQPESEPFWSNRGYLLRLKARAARQQGRDAGPFLQQAAAAGRRAAECAPKSATAWMEQGDTQVETARWGLAQGRNPETALLQSRTFFSKALEVNPQDSDAPRGLAESYWIEAQWLAGRHLDLRTPVEQGIAQATLALKLDPHQAQAQAIRGALRGLRAKQSGRRADAAAAEQDLAQALEANPFLAPAFRPALDEIRAELR